MKKWLIKALLISLALFFTYTYFYQHADKEIFASAASSHVSQVKQESAPVQTVTKEDVSKSAAAQLWKSGQQEETQGVLPRLTQAAGNAAGAIIHQGVVIIASLVNVFMHLFL